MMSLLLRHRPIAHREVMVGCREASSMRWTCVTGLSGQVSFGEDVKKMWEIDSQNIFWIFSSTRKYAFNRCIRSEWRNNGQLRETHVFIGRK